MAVFRYRLQNVLDIKARLEEEAKVEFAFANARLMEEEDKLSKLRQKKSWYEEEGRRIRESVLDINELKDNTKAIDVLKEKIILQEEEVKKASEKLEVVREVLTEAMQERKIYERLKEKSFEEFMHEINVAENKEVDELVSYTYAERIKKEDK